MLSLSLRVCVRVLHRMCLYDDYVPTEDELRLGQSNLVDQKEKYGIDYLGHCKRRSVYCLVYVQ